MNNQVQIEMETKGSNRWMHIHTKEKYEEDYQLPMIRKNKMTGLLAVEGCEVAGCGRYTYDIRGMRSLKMIGEREQLKKRDVESVIQALLKLIELLKEFMLDPNCLILLPEAIYKKSKTWRFCYLPGNKKEFHESFHQLTEYFIRVLDYDEEDLYFAYELHKATMEEQYDLQEILELCKERERKRTEEVQTIKPPEKEEENLSGNVFTLVEETEEETGDMGILAEHQDTQYQMQQSVDTVREESSWRPMLKKAAKHVHGNCWGEWDDLILEMDGQVEQALL